MSLFLFAVLSTIFISNARGASCQMPIPSIGIDLYTVIHRYQGNMKVPLKPRRPDPQGHHIFLWPAVNPSDRSAQSGFMQPVLAYPGQVNGHASDWSIVLWANSFHPDNYTRSPGHQVAEGEVIHWWMVRVETSNHTVFWEMGYRSMTNATKRDTLNVGMPNMKVKMLVSTYLETYADDYVFPASNFETWDVKFINSNGDIVIPTHFQALDVPSHGKITLDCDHRFSDGRYGSLMTFERPSCEMTIPTNAVIHKFEGKMKVPLKPRKPDLISSPHRIFLSPAINPYERSPQSGFMQPVLAFPGEVDGKEWSLALWAWLPPFRESDWIHDTAYQVEEGEVIRWWMERKTDDNNTAYWEMGFESETNTTNRRTLNVGMPDMTITTLVSTLFRSDVSGDGQLPASNFETWDLKLIDAHNNSVSPQNFQAVGQQENVTVNCYQAFQDTPKNCNCKCNGIPVPPETTTRTGTLIKFRNDHSDAQSCNSEDAPEVDAT